MQILMLFAKICLEVMNVHAQMDLMVIHMRFVNFETVPSVIVNHHILSLVKIASCLAAIYREKNKNVHKEPNVSQSQAVYLTVLVPKDLELKQMEHAWMLMSVLRVNKHVVLMPFAQTLSVDLLAIVLTVIMAMHTTAYVHQLK